MLHTAKTTTRGSDSHAIKRLEQLAVNAAESAVGEYHDDISLPRFRHHVLDNGIDFFSMKGTCAACYQVCDNTIGIQALRIREQIGTIHRADRNAIGGRQRLGQLSLQY